MTYISFSLIDICEVVFAIDYPKHHLLKYLFLIKQKVLSLKSNK